jgi:hypothetical protein
VTIQYVGFQAAATLRIYTFRVSEALKATREFTVKIQLRAFRLTPLRFQDGPDICFARLKQKLQGETQEAPLERDLRIGEQDIEEYLQRRYPRKRT